MSPAMFNILAYVFVLILVFIAWLKYREHLHRHRHEHGPHSSRTDLVHIVKAYEWHRPRSGDGRGGLDG